MTKFEDINNKDGFEVSVSLPDILPQKAANFGVFYTASRPCEIIFATERHGVAAGVGITLQIEKVPTGTAKGSGTNILSTAFDANGTVNTNQTKTTTEISSTAGTLTTGDSLAWKLSSASATIKDVSLTLYIIPSGKGDYRR